MAGLERVSASSCCAMRCRNGKVLSGLVNCHFMTADRCLVAVLFSSACTPAHRRARINRVSVTFFCPDVLVTQMSNAYGDFGRKLKDIIKGGQGRLKPEKPYSAFGLALGVVVLAARFRRPAWASTPFENLYDGGLLRARPALLYELVARS